MLLLESLELEESFASKWNYESSACCFGLKKEDFPLKFKLSAVDVDAKSKFETSDEKVAFLGRGTTSSCPTTDWNFVVLLVLLLIEGRRLVYFEHSLL